jgi:DNA-binding transcriptional regulator YbjK
MTVADHSPPAGERPRGTARREALLDAVIRIVAASGVDAVTHRRVAEEAGLPLASTTYWFESKEAMLTAALELAAERDIARLQSVIRDPPATNDAPNAILALLFDPVADELRHSRGSVLGAYALWLEAARRPELRELASNWTERYLDATSRLLEQAGSRNPSGDARLVIGAVDGLVVHQLVEGEEALVMGEGAPIREDLRRLIGTLLDER